MATEASLTRAWHGGRGEEERAVPGVGRGCSQCLWGGQSWDRMLARGGGGQDWGSGWDGGHCSQRSFFGAALSYPGNLCPWAPPIPSSDGIPACRGSQSAQETDLGTVSIHGAVGHAGEGGLWAPGEGSPPG